MSLDCLVRQAQISKLDYFTRLDSCTQLRHASTSVSIGRDPLVAAVARALPVTLTYAPYGFCLISRFPFVSSLRAPLSALFEQVGLHPKSWPYHIPRKT